jgi:hypothetical protein
MDNNNNINIIIEKFNNNISKKREIDSFFILLQEKVDYLNNIYQKYLASNIKDKLHGLDSLHFQSKLVVQEMDNNKVLFNIVKNRIYGEYYKLFKNILKYSLEILPDSNILKNFENKEFPIYKDLSITDEYDWELVIELFNDIITILNNLIEDKNLRDTYLNEQKKCRDSGININNMVDNYNFNINFIINNIDLYSNYLHNFNNFHDKYLSRLINTIDLFYSQVIDDISNNKLKENTEEENNKDDNKESENIIHDFSDNKTFESLNTNEFMDLENILERFEKNKLLLRETIKDFDKIEFELSDSELEYKFISI